MRSRLDVPYQTAGAQWRSACALTDHQRQRPEGEIERGVQMPPITGDLAQEAATVQRCEDQHRGRITFAYGDSGAISFSTKRRCHSMSDLPSATPARPVVSHASTSAKYAFTLHPGGAGP